MPKEFSYQINRSSHTSMESDRLDARFEWAFRFKSSPIVSRVMFHMIVLDRPVLVGGGIRESVMFWRFHRSVFRILFESTSSHVNIMIDQTKLSLKERDILVAHLMVSSVVSIGEKLIFDRSTQQVRLHFVSAMVSSLSLVQLGSSLWCHRAVERWKDLDRALLRWDCVRILLEISLHLYLNDRFRLLENVVKINLRYTWCKTRVNRTSWFEVDISTWYIQLTTKNISWGSEISFLRCRNWQTWEGLSGDKKETYQSALICLSCTAEWRSQTILVVIQHEKLIGSTEKVRFQIEKLCRPQLPLHDIESSIDHCS